MYWLCIVYEGYKILSQTDPFGKAILYQCGTNTIVTLRKDPPRVIPKPSI